MNKKNRVKSFLFAAFVITSLLTITPFVSAADLTGKTIAGISITGNEAVQEEQIASVLKVKAGDTFNDKAIEQDMKAIFALDNFYDVQANFVEVPEGIKVVYSVMEKKPIGDVRFTGNTKISTDDLLKLVSAIKGTVIDNKALSDTSRSIEQYYHDQGYILAKVTNMTMDPGGTIHISINEGIVEDIVIKGNTKTKTSVIYRELNLKPQEPFNANVAKRSLQKIYNLGFFEDVNSKLNPGKEPNAVVVQIDVVEKKTGSVSVGGGYSGTYGFSTLLGVGDTNLKGTGNNLDVELQHSYYKSLGTSWKVNFTNPYIDDKKTSLSISVFNTTGEYSDYGLDGDNTELRSTYYRRSRGFNVTLGRPQGEYTRNYITFTKRKDTYLEYVSGPVDYRAKEDDDTYDADYNTEYLENNFGVVHSVTLARVYDNRDNVFNPTAGKRISLSSEFAGRALGGEFDFDKYTFDYRQYFKVGSKQVLALRFSSGAITGEVPDASLFTVGGIDTLRGYEDDMFKGKKMFTSTLEYRYPIAKKIQGVVFADAGNAWYGSYNLNDLYYSIGSGIRVETPVGPIRLEYGHGSEGGKFHFSFGTQF